MELLFVHGPAAAGKLTVARRLGERLHYGVFHNHLVVDALTAVFPFGSPAFVRLREEFWLATFAEAASAGTDLVFTFAPEATVQPGFAERARRVVSEAGGNVRFVRLEVSDAEQERRIENTDRSEFAKLNDLDTLRRLRRAPRSSAPLDQPPADLVIDTEHSTPDEAAQLIIDAFALRPAPPHQRYPDA